MNKLEEKEGKVQATKFDGAKVQTSLFPVRAYLETCKVFTFGGIKYSIGNWKEGDGFSYNRLMNAADRHIKEFQLGKNLDPETGACVLAHAMCCLAMLLETHLTGKGIDDRGDSQIIDWDDPKHYDMSLSMTAIEFLKEMNKITNPGASPFPQFVNQKG